MRTTVEQSDGRTVGRNAAAELLRRPLLAASMLLVMGHVAPEMVRAQASEVARSVRRVMKLSIAHWPRVVDLGEACASPKSFRVSPDQPAFTRPFQRAS